MIVISGTSAQDFPNRVTAPLGAPPPNEMDDDIQGKFERQEWSPGIVKFKSSRPVMSVPVIFDADNNQLYYMERNTVMEFVDSVSEFMMKLVKNNDSTYLLFRNGYPPLQSNSAATYYEVMVDGNIQLLKCRAKTIYRFKEPEVLDQRKPQHKELHFAYLPGNKLIIVHKDMDYLIEHMPEFADRLKQVEKKYKLKIKSEKKLRELFVRMNESD